MTSTARRSALDLPSLNEGEEETGEGNVQCGEPQPQHGSANPSPCPSPQSSPKIRNNNNNLSNSNGSGVALERPQSIGSSLPSCSSLGPEKNPLDLESAIVSVGIGGGYCPGSCSSASSEDTVSRSSESAKSVDLQRSSDIGSMRDLAKEKKSSEKKKKTSSWYNVLNPTYKSRSDDFKRLFKDLPESERLIVDYSCAVQKDILVQGRMYISQNCICFYANIFRWETSLSIRCKDVTAMTKEKTARVIPNAIQICTDTEKHFFTSFSARDKTYLMLFRVWQNALMEQPMSIQELWQWVHYSYGEELGLTSDDDDYVAPLAEEDLGKSNGLLSLPECNDGKVAGTPTDSACHSDHSNRTSFKESSAGSPDSTMLVDGPNSQALNGLSFLPDLFPDKVPETPCSLPSPSQISSPSDHQLPTDLSDNTSESDNDVAAGGTSCPCESHSGKELYNTVIPMSVDHLFTLIFCESKFYVDFQHSRKTTDIMQSCWQPHAESGNKVRQVTYTLHLNFAMGAKTAQTTETQTMMNVSKPGSLYIIDIDAVATGLPYSDTFYTAHRYCLTQVSPGETRLRVHTHIKYKKSVWGLVKTFIEKNAYQAVEDYLKEIEAALLTECNRTTQPGILKKTRRRRRPARAENLKGETIADGQGKVAYTQTAGQRLVVPGLEVTRVIASPELLIRFIVIILMALLFINGILYYKLWLLEVQASKMALPPGLLDLQFIKNSPRSQEEWAKLVRKQEILHQVELQKWTSILKSSVQILQQTEDSLNMLQKSIRPFQIERIMQLFTADLTAATMDPTVENQPPKESYNSEPTAS